MEKVLLFLALYFTCGFANAQTQSNYYSELKTFRAQYISGHEVVKRKDRKYFRFFEPDINYLVPAGFERIIDTSGFLMLTSSGKRSKYYLFGKVNFTLKNRNFSLQVDQSDKLMKTTEFADYVFIPFTDSTTATESYGAGRYIDLSIKDLADFKIDLDFNKAYNPYCAYTTGFNCPVPTRQNYLNISIKAGERDFAKKSH